jgi:RNA 2',3'-cyclic 3'-phosphodiesterase
MKTVRAFVAVELPDDIKTFLSDTVQTLATGLPAAAVRWVRPEAMHLTLRFLGDTAADQLPQIAATLDQATAGRKPFTLKLGQMGCFPSPKRPRIIWAGVGGDEAELQALKGALDGLLQPLGWPVEKKAFHPHLTLGRVKDERVTIELPWGKALEALPLPVTAVHLIESQLRPAGPLYTVCHSSVLER